MASTINNQPEIDQYVRLPDGGIAWSADITDNADLAIYNAEKAAYEARKTV